MDATLVEKLKLACNQFYLGKDLDKGLMSDKEFDELRKIYESENGSVKNLVDWDTDITMENEPMEALDKSIAGDNNLSNAVDNYINSEEITEFYLNYKYDGSSIKAYYKNGKLEKILGTPDVQFGFLRTKAFWNLFPHEVDPAIKSIQGEVLVDASVYGQLARNKANGLTNSKWKDDEVESEAFIRVYNIQFTDGNWSFDRNKAFLNSLPQIKLSRERRDANDKLQMHEDIVFDVAEKFGMLSAPKDSIIIESESNTHFQVDGVVMYSLKGVHGFKFYYTESVVTTVEEIEWIHQVNGSFVPKLRLDPIELNEKYIQRVASGGVPNMINNKMGRGAKVRVILANMTIPKVIEVLEPSEDYQFPKCTCGYQLSEKDIYGSSLKCQNLDEVCNSKLLNWIPAMGVDMLAEDAEMIKSCTFEDYFRYGFFWFMNFLYIDRWDSHNKFKFEDNTPEHKQVVEDILKLIDSQDDKKFKELFEQNWYFSELNWCTMNINAKSWLGCMKKLKEDWSLVSEDYFNKLNEEYQRLTSVNEAETL